MPDKQKKIEEIQRILASPAPDLNGDDVALYVGRLAVANMQMEKRLTELSQAISSLIQASE